MKIFVDVASTLRKKTQVPNNRIKDIVFQVIKKSFPLKENKIFVSIVICGQEKIRKINI